MEVLYQLSYGSIMAPQVGLEPTTDRLTADSSTTELLRNNKDNLYLIKILIVSQEVFSQHLVQT